MTGDQYIRTVINKKRSKNLTFYDSRLTEIKNVIREWAGNDLYKIKLSGSCVKKTAIKGKSDCDLFISMKSNTSDTLNGLYYSLDEHVREAGYRTKLQNVSIAIYANGLDIDLVPARIQQGYYNYHSLYTRRNDSWIKTNIDIHIKQVLDSGRQNEIIALKIWRTLNGLKFPSIYLDMVVMYALKYKKRTDTANNFLMVLEFLTEEFWNTAFVDPSNTNNIISNLIDEYQKEKICNAACQSLNQNHWKNIIW
jgi:hypothetical protein